MTFTNTLRRLIPTTLRLRPPSAAAIRVEATSAHVVSIGRHEFPRIDVAPGRVIECLSGCAWITIDHDPKDVVISAGEHWVADVSARIMVTALEPARIAYAQ